MEKPGIDLLHLVFLYKPPVYKQLALHGKLLSNFQNNPFSLSNNKNYKLKKNGVFTLQ